MGRALLPLLLAVMFAAAPAAASEAPALAQAVAAARAECRAAGADRGLTAVHRRALDHQLWRWLDGRLAAAARDTDADALQQQLRAELEPQPTDGSCALDSLDGDAIGHIDVAMRRQGAALLATTAIGITCGGDQSAALYHWNRGWKRFWRSRDGLGPLLAPPQRLAATLVAPTAPLVLTLGADEWCTSNWRQATVRLWRGAPGRPPALLLERSVFAFLGEVSGPLNARLDDADAYVEYRAASLDAGRHSRWAIHHYRIDSGDGRVRRLDPIALSPADFVEEWLGHPWAASAAWTEPAARESAGRRHAALRGRGGAPSLSGEFVGPALRCRRDPGLWQVRMDFADQPPRRRTTVFLVRWSDPFRFRLAAVANHPRPDCDDDADPHGRERTLLEGKAR